MTQAERDLVYERLRARRRRLDQQAIPDPHFVDRDVIASMRLAGSDIAKFVQSLRA